MGYKNIIPIGNPKKQKRHAYFYGDAETQAAMEQIALQHGMTMAELQLLEQAAIEQQVLDLYQKAVGWLSDVGMQIESNEEGNALLQYLTSQRGKNIAGNDVVATVLNMRDAINKGEVQETVAYAEIGQDVRPALFRMATQMPVPDEVRQKAVYLLRLLDVIRMNYYYQMLLGLEGQQRDPFRDAEIQKLSLEAQDLGKQLSVQVETDYTLDMFDKSELLVSDNLQAIDIGQQPDGQVVIKSNDQAVDKSMEILGAKSDAAEDLFTQEFGNPVLRKYLIYTAVVLGLGYMLSRHKA
jgi:hypothetical protein